MDGGREREWGGGGRDKRKVGEEETGNDRTATAGWKRDTFIRLSVCVSVGNLLFFYFLYGQNTPRRTEKMKKSRKMPLLHRKRLMAEVSNNKTHLCGSV